MGKMAYIARLVIEENFEELCTEVGSRYARKLINEYKNKEENNDSNKER
jgi:hypothetical protein|tara:strand:+ start:339 stop:485 length:147 start_codon:yes stop_codon:yes gene_type:complete